MSNIDCLVTVFVVQADVYCVSAASLITEEDGEQLEGPDWCAPFQSPGLLRAFLTGKMRLSPERVREVMRHLAREEPFTFVEKLSPKALAEVRRRDPKRKRRRRRA